MLWAEMRTRSTPVGAVVLVLASFFAVGCTAETAAVFDSLLIPAGATTPSAADELPGDGEGQPGASQTWWTHPDGYAMSLPAGWSGVALTTTQTDRFIAAIAASYPGLADRISGVLEATKSRVSAVAADSTAQGDMTPMMLIVAQSTEGRKARGVKTRVYEEIAALPGIQGNPARYDVRLPAGSGVRFEYTIVDPDLGNLQVFSYLFRFGSQAYLVNFVASSDTFNDDVELEFDSIAQSLRFGV